MEQDIIAESSNRAHFGRFRDSNPQSGSSESAQSEYGSIYNALKASSSGTEDNNGRQYASSQHHYPFQSSDLGGNIAMFLSTSPKPTAVEHPTEPRRTRSRWRRSHTLPDNWYPAKMKTIDPIAELFKDAKAKANNIRLLGHRRAASLSDADTRSRTPRWAANLFSPVRPFFPRYPPPDRSPTPPGIPSFGSPEAINYSRQFSVRSYAPSPPPERTPSRRATEYAHTLRRILGIASPVDPQLSRRQTYTLARAEDGTAVQGRFPYRASGHGVNLHRQLDDHPFHRVVYPVPELDVPNLDDRFNAGIQPLRREHHDVAKSRYSTPAVPRRVHSNQVSRSRHAHLPSLSAVGQRHRPSAPFLVSPATTSYYSCMSQPRTGVTVPAVDGEIGPSRTGRANSPPRGMLYQQQSPAQAARPVSILTASTTRDTQGTMSFWTRYELLSHYLPCCCLAPAGNDDEDNNDDGATIGDDSRTSRISRTSRTSGETFMTARSWADDQEQLQYRRSAAPDPPPRPPPNTFAGWNPVFRERCPRPIRSPLVANPMLA